MMGEYKSDSKIGGKPMTIIQGTGSTERISKIAVTAVEHTAYNNNQRGAGTRCLSIILIFGLAYKGKLSEYKLLKLCSNSLHSCQHHHVWFRYANV